MIGLEPLLEQLRDLARQTRQASNLFYSLGVRDEDCANELMITTGIG